MAPFGGIESAGMGRENGRHAIDGDFGAKTVRMSFADAVPDPFNMR